MEVTPELRLGANMELQQVICQEPLHGTGDGLIGIGTIHPLETHQRTFMGLMRSVRALTLAASHTAPN